MKKMTFVHAICQPSDAVRGRLPVTAALALAGTLAACGGSSSSSSDDRGPTDTTVSLPFEAVYNSSNDPVTCDGTLSGLGAGVDVQLEDFRLYLHDVRVTTSQQRELPLTLDDTLWQGSGVALLDFRDFVSCGSVPQTPNTDVTGTVALNEGERIDGVQFKIGLPESLNHTNLVDAATPLNVPTMHWSWQSGYKFMRLDVTVAGGDDFKLHLGSTDCAGDPEAGDSVSCDRGNRPEVRFDTFTLGQDTIVIDYAAMVATALDGVDDGGAPGCMSGVSDPECAGVFAALGLDLASGTPDSQLNQVAFRLK